MTDEQARRVLGLVGLGLRSRNAVVGTEQVRAAAKKGRVVLALVADDASAHSLAKLHPLLSARRVRVVQGLTAQQLGTVSGRNQTAAIGVLDRALANGILGVMDSGA
ncbi:MAG: ribosomal L7Ae/L30e/S12e/Gadd45 family protein [Gemmatimonadota bacterium]|nr:ribosomal L7Ae/L30e/S12e/Gadd45 family protein [Gemmatimonadota bacterium]